MLRPMALPASDWAVEPERHVDSRDQETGERRRRERVATGLTFLELIREELTAARERGVPFELAWPRAVDEALGLLPHQHRGHWARALEDTRSAWAAAYANRPHRSEPMIRQLEEAVAA
jgi:hypothetical protein